jgi:DNA-binding transcriptional MerR regulator
VRSAGFFEPSVADVLANRAEPMLAYVFIRWLHDGSYFPGDNDYIEIRRSFDRAGPGSRFGADGSLPPVPSEEAPHVTFIVEVMKSFFTQVLLAFGHYYVTLAGGTAETLSEVALRAFRGAIVLCSEEMVRGIRETRREDVYDRVWPLIVAENFKTLFAGAVGIVEEVLAVHKELDAIKEDAEFGRLFEAHWQRLRPFRDDYYGFLVFPKLTPKHMARYQRVRIGATDIRYEVSDYMLHLLKERPSTLEVFSELFKDKAFAERVREAYEPLKLKLIDKITDMIKKSSEVDEAYRHRIAQAVDKAFERLLKSFDFYFKPRPEGPMPRWRGILASWPIAEGQEELLNLFPDFTREIHFSRYLERKLEFLAWELLGGKPPQTFPLEELSNDLEAVEEEQERTRRGEVTRKARNPWDDLIEKTYLGLDGKRYFLVNEMAQAVGLETGLGTSPRQLRAWAMAGHIKAHRRSDVDGRLYSQLKDWWLFEPTRENALHIAEIAHRPGRLDVKAPKGCITRRKLAEIMELTPNALIYYEKKGILTPLHTDAGVCYAVEDVRALKEYMKKSRER